MAFFDNNLDKTSITLKMLIDANLISPGQEVVCSRPDVKGTIKEDGSLIVTFEGKERVFPFLSGAARYIEKRSLNGWIYWHITINSQIVKLDAFRDQYLQNKVIL